MHFDHERLIKAASRRTGLSDLGDTSSLEGLEVLARSVEEDAGRTFGSRMSIRQVALSILVNRLALVETQRKAPDIFHQPLIAPLIITGLPRSGTTLLHRMLAADPAHYALPLWETLRPAPAAGRTDRRRLQVKLGLAVNKMIIRDFDRIHHVSVDAPEEDLYALGGTFQTWLFWQCLPVYGYIDWYLRQDRAAKYQNYRAWLHIFQAAHPGQRLVLKAPEHFGGIAELMRAVPEACVVQTHRDPVTAFASFTSMVSRTQGGMIGRIDHYRRDHMSLRLLAEETQRHLAARAQLPNAIVDVSYRDLVADPAAIARRVYEEHDLTLSDAARAAIDQYVVENPQGKHGTHRYGPHDLSVGDDEIRSAFKAYNERFGFATRGGSGR